MRANLAFIVVSATLALAAGCNDTDTGAEGLILFTPDDCGLFSCDFSDGLVVGGAIDVTIRGVEGVSTAGVELVSDDPTVFTVAGLPDEGIVPRWEIVGRGEGVAALTAVDSSGRDIDFLEVFVQELDGMQAVKFLGNAVGPVVDDPDFNEVWTINADELTSFFIRPTVAGQEVMGRVSYEALISEALAGFLAESSDPAAGYIEFAVPAGFYDARFTSDNGTVYDVLFDAQ